MQVRFHAPGAAGAPARSLVPRIALAAVVGGVIAACDAERTLVDPEAAFSHSAASNQRTFYGAAVRVGDGVGRTYYTVEGGQVREVGVALSEAALRGLPEAQAHADGDHRHDEEYLLRMHPQNPTPYRNVGLNWNPMGHQPPGIYDLPHFDVHFYTISEAERNAIDPADPEWEQKANRLPTPAFIPANYVPTSVLAGVAPVAETYPRMGLHWVDVTSPELHGETFSTTFIYGSYNGEVNFVEPMITRAFLESKPNFSRVLPKAEQGTNPGRYRVYWHEDRREYRVALTELRTR